MIDFPNSPTIGQTFTDAGTTWVWDGAKWVAQVPPAQAIIAGAPPTGIQGDLWWDDAGGQLYVYYNDGTSAQWVQATNLPNSAIAVPVSIAQGGTAGTTAPAALANLGGAPLASPVFTGNPQGPTPATADSSVSLATTAFVKAQGYAPTTSPTFAGTVTIPASAAIAQPHIAGVTDGSNAAAGQVGEYLTANATNSNMVANNWNEVASLVLSPGDWDVSCSGTFSPSATATSTVSFGQSTTNGPPGINGGSVGVGVVSSTLGQTILASATVRWNVTTSTTVYWMCNPNTGGGSSAVGNIFARRVR